MDRSADAVQLAQTMFGEGIQLVSAIYTNGNASRPGRCRHHPVDWHAENFTRPYGSGDTNQQGGAGTDTSGQDGNPALSELAGAETYDAAMLQATFVPQGPVLTM